MVHTCRGAAGAGLMAKARLRGLTSPLTTIVKSLFEGDTNVTIERAAAPDGLVSPEKLEDPQPIGSIIHPISTS
eukprot:COSAG01_NODE_4660_length_4842_cov_22.777567_3_plen_74_part_00